MKSVFMRFLFFSTILFLCNFSDSCPPSLASLNLPPPVIHMECLRKQNPCQAGYICRRFRCIRSSRAMMGAKSFLGNTASDSQRVGREMEKCCEEGGVPRGCMSFCTPKTYSESSVFQFLSEPNRCPMSSLRVIHYCASRNIDHHACCQTKLVPPDCIDLCSPSAARTQFDESKLHCLQYISIMKSCFFSAKRRQHLINHVVA